MRRAGLAVLALVALAAIPGGAQARRAPAAVGVSEREFSLNPYRHAIRAGTVRFFVTNFGEDVHNLALRTPGGRLTAVSPDIGSGRRLAITARLRRPGRWVLVCTKAGHEQLGMRAVLRVRRR
jgi:plastocyanin